MQRCSMHILCTSWCRSLRTSVDLHSFMVFGRVNVGDLQVPYVKWYFASSELSLGSPTVRLHSCSGMPLPSRCHVVASAVFTAVAKASKVVLPCNING